VTEGRTAGGVGLAARAVRLAGCDTVSCGVVGGEEDHLRD
jgi:hypothetical protein